MRFRWFTLTLLAASLGVVHPCPAGEARAELLAQTIALEDELHSTEWTVDTYHERRDLERRVALQHRIVNAVATLEQALAQCAVTPRATAGGAVQIAVPRTLSDVEIGLISRILHLEDRLEHDDFPVSAHAERKGLEAERERLQATLRKVVLGLSCGAVVVAALP